MEDSEKTYVELEGLRTAVGQNTMVVVVIWVFQKSRIYLPYYAWNRFEKNTKTYPGLDTTTYDFDHSIFAGSRITVYF